MPLAQAVAVSYAPMQGSPVDQTTQISEGDTWVRWICSGTDALWLAGRAMRGSFIASDTLLGYSGLGPVREGGGGGDAGGGRAAGGGGAGGGLGGGSGISLFLQAHQEAA